jgi:hypothetical protein
MQPILCVSERMPDKGHFVTNVPTLPGGLLCATTSIDIATMSVNVWVFTAARFVRKWGTFVS